MRGIDCDYYPIGCRASRAGQIVAGWIADGDIADDIVPRLGRIAAFVDALRQEVRAARIE